jgi:phage tail-like protein
MAFDTAPRVYSADPLRNYKFKVGINGGADGGLFSIGSLGFQSVGGIGTTVEVIEYREGGDNETMKKIPGMVKYDNLTLERGKYIGEQGTDLLRWLNRVWNPLTDAHTNDFRATITIQLLSTYNNNAACEWKFYNAWPVSYKVGDLQTSNSELLIDSVEIAYETLVQQYFDIGGRELVET